MTAANQTKAVAYDMALLGVRALFGFLGTLILPKRKAGEPGAVEPPEPASSKEVAG